MFWFKNELSERNINLICDFLKQKSFHEDVVRVIHSNLEEEEILPEDQRPTSLARSYYLTVRFLLFLTRRQSYFHPTSQTGIMMDCLNIHIYL